MVTFHILKASSLSSMWVTMTFLRQFTDRVSLVPIPERIFLVLGSRSGWRCTHLAPLRRSFAGSGTTLDSPSLYRRSRCPRDVLLVLPSPRRGTPSSFRSWRATSARTSQPSKCRGTALGVVGVDSGSGAGHVALTTFHRADICHAHPQ